jgi:hypothetical protein
VNLPNGETNAHKYWFCKRNEREVRHKNDLIAMSFRDDAIGYRMIVISAMRPLGYGNLNALRNTTKIAIQNWAGRRVIDWS